jgi:hypothetical protein
LHPTIDEQLEGVARQIDRTLERHPDDDSVDRLRAAAGTLRRIADSWAAMLPFFTWDNAAMCALLEQLEAASPEVRAAGVRPLSAVEIDPLDVRAAHERNKVLRGLLAETVRALPSGGAAARAKIAAHLRERIARDPFSGRGGR